MQVLLKFLEKQVAYVLSVEDKQRVFQNARHVHFSFLMHRPTRTDSVKRSLRAQMSKFYTTYQLNVKVAVTPSVVDYILKDDFVIYQHNIQMLRDYIQLDSVRNSEEIKINSYYKNQKLKYAYDNKDTWLPYFSKFKITIDQWRLLLVDLDANVPANIFKLRSFYNFYTIKQDEKKASELKPIFEKSKVFFKILQDS